MSYIRVIPRDLFNEANLLKCYGRLYICLERDFGELVHMGGEDGLERFDIVQRTDDGWTYIANIPLTVRGVSYRLVRPLNSREPWPLYAEEIGNPDADPIEVFDADGELSQAFRYLLAGSIRKATQLHGALKAKIIEPKN